jgi:peptidoglycan hydrolase-like protein with peptidoglycan-binding domain
VITVQQGNHLPQIQDTPQRNRRAQRYERPGQPQLPVRQNSQPHDEQPAPQDSGAFLQPPVQSFTQKQRTVYQSQSSQPPYPQQHHAGGSPQTRGVAKRYVTLVIVFVVMIVFIRIGFPSNQANKTVREPGTAVAIQTGAPMATEKAATASPSYTSTPTLLAFSPLSQGTAGEDVEQMQQRLIELGYLQGAADGIYGNKTYNAVWNYQSQNGIPETGAADSDTLASLYSSVANKAKAAAATPETDWANYIPPNDSDRATTGQMNALSSAKSYLEFMSFSYNGLVDQLEYEEFTHSEAVYGADHCGADWNEQALLSAKSYLNFSAFSYQGLVEQLEYDQFTSKQAAYAADRCGASWKEQAAQSAEAYLSISSFSRADLIEQLEYEGFTHSQAVYGAKANGY